MAEFTLLELHLDDATFTANAPLSGEGGSDDKDGSDAGDGVGRAFDVDASTEDGDGRSVGPLLVALGVLVVLAIAVKKLRGGDEDAGVEADH